MLPSESMRIQVPLQYKKKLTKPCLVAAILMAIKVTFQGKTYFPQKHASVWRYTSPHQHEARWAQPIPTPVTTTQALGGWSASAMALAKVLVVSTRLLITSLQKASPHLEKGEPLILPTRISQETIAPWGAPMVTSQAQEMSHKFPPPQSRRRT